MNDIFLHADLVASLYPTKSELVYGEWLRNQYEAGEISAPVSDPDLPLLLAQVRHTAFTLFGPNASSVLPVISRSDVHRAIGDALPALMEGLEGDERNVLFLVKCPWIPAFAGIQKWCLL